jgi:hypothetical protein
MTAIDLEWTRGRTDPALAGNTRSTFRWALGFALLAGSSVAAIAGCATALALGQAEWHVAGRLPFSANEDVFIHDRDGAAAAQIVVSQGTTYLIGWPTYIVSDTIREVRAAGVVWHKNGSVQLLPAPPGASGIATPRAASDGEKGLHLIGATRQILCARPPHRFCTHISTVIVGRRPSDSRPNRLSCGWTLQRVPS